MTIQTASVKVMRSYDYCHFEVCLSATVAIDDYQHDVDELRKTAARLADKAVEQYKVAKGEAAKRLERETQKHYQRARIIEIREKAEGDRTINEIAELKAWDDRIHEINREYDYQDDWDEHQ